MGIDASGAVFRVGIILLFVAVLPVLDYGLASLVGGFEARSASEDPEFRRILGLIFVADTLAIAAAFFATSLEWPGSQWGWLVLGIAVMCAGSGLRYWSVLTLGRFFHFVITIQNDHRIVKSGPYRLVRHPAYTGLLLVQLGIGIALANSLSVVLCLALPILGLMPRIQREELALLGNLGSEYADYAVTTKRLIPKVW